LEPAKTVDRAPLPARAVRLSRGCARGRAAGLALAFGALIPLAVCASALEQFSRFLSTTQSARAAFEQKVYSRNAKLVQESKGTLAFLRPGKFRWSYEKPYAQLIVGDGTRVWVYDEDLRQVTVKRVDQALTSTPAALLAGDNEVLRSFKLSERAVKDGLEWLEAIPKDKEGGFDRIRLGFGPSGPEVMELSDSFGQLTVLRLSAFERNPKLDPGLFRFVPPKGVDVVGDVQKPRANGTGEPR
jgi:outer membrane lipoprotein carrier protein